MAVALYFLAVILKCLVSLVHGFMSGVTCLVSPNKFLYMPPCLVLNMIVNVNDIFIMVYVLC